MTQLLKNFFFLSLLLFSHFTHADGCVDANFDSTPLITPPEPRIAFVVGNSAYEKLDELPNAENDAQDFAAALMKLGFKVVCGINLDRQAFMAKLSEFRSELDRMGPDTVSLFYYAGHGAQIKSNNYILPLNIDISTPDRLDSTFINLNEILRTLMEARNRQGSRFVILDACRDNPLGDGWAKPRTDFDIEELFWAFGTGYGKGAIEFETDRNGLFTKHILRNMFVKGDTFEQLMKKVTSSVIKESGGLQKPEVGFSQTRDFMFVPGTIFDKIPVWLKGVFVSVIVLLFVTSFFFYQHRQKTAWTRGIDLTAQLNIDKKVAEEVRRKSRLATDEIVGYVKDVADKKLVGLVTSKYDMVIGRNSNVNIQIDRDSVSGEHAQLGWDKQKKEFWLEDMDSTNGTWWGKGKQLQPGQRYPLRTGELFYLADKNSPMVVIAHDEGI